MSRPYQGHPMSVTFLGTSGSWPTADHNVSATAVKRGGEIILFDCGEGTQRQFQKSPLSHMQVTKICITHFHGDHTYGLPGYLKTMQLNDRVAPLDILGPPGIKRFMEDILRIAPLAADFVIRVHEMRPGVPLDFPDGYTITTAEGVHGIRNHAFALQEMPRPGRFDKARALELGVPEGPLFRRLQHGEPVTTPGGRAVGPEDVLGPARPGRKIVVSGDTRPCQPVVELARGATMLIHEATYQDEHQAEAVEFGHSTAREAAQVAREAAVEALWLHHFSPRYRNREQSLAEAREVFPATYMADDFLSVDVPFPE